MLKVMTLQIILKFLLIAAMAATLGALIIGLSTMFKAGHQADERSNKMMRLRILFQALAILFFSLLLFLKAK
jgi:hypothetical protein